MIGVAKPGSVKVGDRVVVLPLNACGKCSLCRAGDWVYCENNIDFKHAYELVEEFINAFHTEVNRLQRELSIGRGHIAKERDRVARQLDGSYEAIADGLRTTGLKAKLDELE